MGVPTAKDIGIKKLVDKATNSMDLPSGLDGSGLWKFRPTTGAGRKVGEGVSGGQGRTSLTARFNIRTHKHTYIHVQLHDSCKCKCAQHCKASF